MMLLVNIWPNAGKINAGALLELRGGGISMSPG
jgi:hypothetical protein